MLRLTIIAALMAFAAPAMAASNAHSAIASDLRSIYSDLNGMCRGWPGDDPHTDEACEVREKVGKLLKKMGVQP